MKIPLLNRVEPYDNESLGSIVERLKIANYYESSWFNGVIGTSGRDNPSIHFRNRKLERLSDLSLIPVDSLYGMTIHSLGMSIFPNTWLKFEDEYGFVRRECCRAHITNDDKFCPLCVVEECRHLLPWHFSLVSACSKHNVLLVDKCSVCGGKLKVSEIISGQHECGSNLLQEIPQSISDNAENVEAVRFVSYLVGLIPEYIGPDQRENPIFELPPPLLYSLVTTLNKALIKFEAPISPIITPGEIINVNSAENINRVTVISMKLLSDWPKNFYDFIREYRKWQADNDHMGLSTEFGYLRRMLASLNIGYLNDAFSEYILEEWPGLLDSRVKEFRDNPKILDFKKYYSAQETAKKLRLSIKQVNWLINSGELVAKQIFSENHYYYLVDRLGVDKLESTRAEYFSIHEVADRLHISVFDVSELIKSGYLEDNRWIAGVKSIFVTKESLETFEDRYINSINPIEDQDYLKEEMLDFAETAKAFNFIKYAKSKILDLVKEETLKAYRIITQPGLLGLQFSYSEVQEIRSYLLKEYDQISGAYYQPIEQKSLKSEVILSRDRVARLLGVSPVVVDRWSAGALLPQVERVNSAGKRVKAIRIQDYIKFRREYMFTEQAAQYLDLKVETFLSWVRSGRIKPCAEAVGKLGKRYLFKKQDFEAFKKENRVSAPETAKLLGVSLGSIHRMVKRGTLTPIGGPGHDETKHLMFNRQEVKKLIGGAF